MRLVGFGVKKRPAIRNHLRDNERGNLKKSLDMLLKVYDNFFIIVILARKEKSMKTPFLFTENDAANATDLQLAEWLDDCIRQRDRITNGSLTRKKTARGGEKESAGMSGIAVPLDLKFLGSAIETISDEIHRRVNKRDQHNLQICIARAARRNRRKDDRYNVAEFPDRRTRSRRNEEHEPPNHVR